MLCSLLRYKKDKYLTTTLYVIFGSLVVHIKEQERREFTTPTTNETKNENHKDESVISKNVKLYECFAATSRWNMKAYFSAISLLRFEFIIRVNLFVLLFAFELIINLRVFVDVCFTSESVTKTLHFILTSLSKSDSGFT